MRPALAAAVAVLLLSGCASPPEPVLEAVVSGDADDQSPAVITATLTLGYDTTYHDPGCGSQAVEAYAATMPGAEAEPRTGIALYDADGAPITACVAQEKELEKGEHTFTFLWDGADHQDQPVAPGDYDVVVWSRAGDLTTHVTVTVPG